MKKAIIITLSLIAFLCVYTIAFQWRFNPARHWDLTDEEITKRSIENLEVSNAAKFYLRACLLTYDDHSSDLLYERFDKVLTEGWHENDPELEEYVASYEPALDLVREGVGLEHCSMPIDDLIYGVSYLAGCRQIARVMLAKARMMEWNGELEKAVRTYSDLLHFSADVADNGMIVQTLVGIAMEGLAYEGLESYLGRLGDRSVCRQLFEDLVEIEQSRASVSGLLENEFDNISAIFEDWKRGILYSDDLPEDPGPGDYLVDAATRSIGYVSFSFYISRHRRQAEEFNADMLEISRMPYPEIFNGTWEKELAGDKLSQTWFDMYQKVIFTTARQETIRRGNIAKVALHLHKLESGEYPETLDPLSPLVPEEMLIDPFSTNRFIYQRTDEGYLLYSLGGDMDDDGGKPDAPPWTLETDGDIVFNPPNASADREPA